MFAVLVVDWQRFLTSPAMTSFALCMTGIVVTLGLFIVDVPVKVASRNVYSRDDAVDIAMC